MVITLRMVLVLLGGQFSITSAHSTTSKVNGGNGFGVETIYSPWSERWQYTRNNSTSI